MAQARAKEKLVDFLEERAFRPVLDASPDRYDSESKKKKLEDAQERTRRELDRYRNDYDTAEDVRRNFRNDLNSSAAQKVHSELKELGLPTINDVRDDFERLANDLGVGTS